MADEQAEQQHAAGQRQQGQQQGFQRVAPAFHGSS
jgi:hypothetical protein